ncbi:HlyD family type I secretion periplasmic adaptor subunit [Roseomonas terrae]|jgi:HlyD family secretion protein|uniref:Membrane fusion protein (MFP) family protein n=1 Tax=Neoroseomonas terrae TaxID=424799 RepID=A0ABS5EGS8_9PROT|nr:HlyD family type I secretion periplasmic adaptor subunit [Neoroseomonas terrae]MBR0650221.1 HlyD family type I secretion periplasmic adaptor subunit [Neoroseomonas terrae]
MSAAADALEHAFDAAMPPPRIGRLVAAALLVLVLGVGGLLAWSSVTPIERAVIGQGQLAAEGRRKTVMLLEPGILRRLLVREGERVETGQPLFQLDTTQADALAAQARAMFLGQSMRATRLMAEQQDSRELEVPRDVSTAARSDPTIAAIVAAESRLFAARWEAYDGALGVSRARIGQFQEQMGAYAAQREATARRLVAIREELTGVTELVGRGFATRTRQWELQRAEAELLGNLGQYQGQEAQAREAMAQAELEVANTRLNRQQEVARDLQDAQAQRADAEQRLRGAEDVLMRRTFVASEPGIITDIRFFTPGSSIAAGTAVLDLVPVGDRLEAEVRVSLTDIENVHVGQPARLRLSAFRSRDVPLLPTEVTYVSADRQVDEQGLSYFVARLALPAEVATALPQGANLAPGMPVEAFLLGERRNALSYVLRPLLDGLRRSLRD